MAIYKAKLESNFAVISNILLQDKELSYEATGLLAMMLSLPDDWKIHKSWLQDQKIKCGRDKLTSMMNELVDNGYVRRKVRQSEDGKLNGVDWLVYPESTVSLENRKTVNPSDVKSDTTKETDIQNKQVNNIDRFFDIFWQSGMRKVNKSGALKSFKKALKDENGKSPEQFASELANDVQLRIQSNQFGFDKMHPTTYLNQKRWNDEYETNQSANLKQSDGLSDSKRAILEARARRDATQQSFGSTMGSHGRDVFEQVGETEWSDSKQPVDGSFTDIN